MSERERMHAVEMRLKEIETHAEWLKDHADLVELKGLGTSGAHSLATVIHKAVLAEREECAKLAEEYGDPCDNAGVGDGIAPRTRDRK